MIKKKLVTNKGHNYNQKRHNPAYDKAGMNDAFDNMQKIASQDIKDMRKTQNQIEKENISSPPKKEKGGGDMREAALEQTKKKAKNGQKSKSKDTTNGEKLDNKGYTVREVIHIILADIEILRAELAEHKRAIKYLLSNNKKFQNEIQKKEEFEKTQT